MGQYEKILKNPDVIWAAEIDVTYNLQPPENPDSIRQNEIVFWKNDPGQNRFPYRNEELLMEKLLQVSKSGEWPAWQFANDSILKWFGWQSADTVLELSKAESAYRLAWGADTIVTFDVETGAEFITSLLSDLGSDRFIAVRAKQLLYFDQKKGDFELYTFAVAPVCKRYDYYRTYKGEWEGIRRFEYTPLWLKMPPYSRKKQKRKLKINDPHITWAAQVRTRNNSPVPDSLLVLKNSKPRVMQVLLDRFNSDKHYRVEDALGGDIPFNTRHKMLFSSDSTLVIDPVTYAEKIVATNKAIDANTILNLRLIEDWYWDERQKRLLIRLSGFAPVFQKYDVNGDPRFAMPLFYRRK